MTAKIIGKFQEIDGEEFSSIADLVKKKGLIGSTSADVGLVELFYDNDGNTYAVAHDSEEYYGAKGDDVTLTPFTVSTKTIITTTLMAGIAIYAIKKHNDTKHLIKHIRSN